MNTSLSPRLSSSFDEKLGLKLIKNSLSSAYIKVGEQGGQEYMYIYIYGSEAGVRVWILE